MGCEPRERTAAAPSAAAGGVPSGCEGGVPWGVSRGSARQRHPVRQEVAAAAARGRKHGTVAEECGREGEG
jgi:hypothetical protein